VDLDLALEQAGRQSRRLGPVLVERRFATREQIEDALRLQTCAILFAALSWEGGSLRFEPDQGSPPPLEEISLRIATAELILQVVKSLEAPSSVRKALGDTSRRLRLVKNPPVRIEGLALSPADAFVLSRADGQPSIRELLEITPLPPESVERSLLALLSVGVVECFSQPSRRLPSMEAATSQPVARPESAVQEAPRLQHDQDDERRLQEIDSVFASLRIKNDWDMLGVDRGASADQIRKAYQGLARRFHPDTVRNAPPEQAERVKAIFMRASEAYSAAHAAAQRKREDPRVRAPETVRSPEPIPRVIVTAPKPAPAPRPEEILRSAEEALAERPWEALALLESATPHITEELRQRARLLRARAWLRSPGSFRAAELELREILQEDPGCVAALMALGGFYRDRGLEARAASMFRKVLEAEPGHHSAIAQLQAISRSETSAPQASDLRWARALNLAAGRSAGPPATG
jgi:hypothetical protein